MSLFDIPHGASVQGQQTYALWSIFFWTAVGVAATVYALILWSILRYRKRSDALPPQFRNNVPIEIVYTAVPLAIVVGLFVLTVRTETFIDAVGAEPPAVVIDVVGFDWSWQFRYEGTGVRITGSPEHPPEMVVPAGQAFRVVLSSADVMHAFWVPAFLFKRDAFPGVTNRFDVLVPRPGTFVGQCAEFCGLDHARMLFSVRAVPAPEFRQWLGRAKAASPP